MSAAATSRKAKHETQRLVLDGGTVVYVEESHALPIVTLVVALMSALTA